MRTRTGSGSDTQQGHSQPHTHTRCTVFLVLALLTMPGAGRAGTAHFFRERLMPPPAGLYVVTGLWSTAYQNGVVIRNIGQRLPTQSVEPPIPQQGQNLRHTFAWEPMEVELSFDGGQEFTPSASAAAATIELMFSHMDGDVEVYVDEATALNFQPVPGVFIRESPTLSSLGQTRIRPIAGGHMIDSFFDIYTEISIDGGVTWSVAAQAAHMELKTDPATIPAVVSPRAAAPMPNGQYGTPQPLWQCFASGIQFRDVRNRLFTDWLVLPPPGAEQIHTCGSQWDLMFSSDSGSTWLVLRLPMLIEFACKNVREFAGQTTFETEMLALTVSGSGLPGGIMLRESPTRASEGGATLAVASGGGGGAGGYDISSFFDIFTEISTDGGSSWSPPTNGAARMVLERIAPAYAFPTNTQPPPCGEYVQTQRHFAHYPPGIVLSNLAVRGFTAAVAPPAAGATNTHACGATVDMRISYDNGTSWHTVSAPANLTVQTAGRLGSDGVTEYYDTEMTQLDISGGGLSSVLFRESPTRTSLGRTTASSVAEDGYWIDSFFDIFTEVSTDGGTSWWPTDSGPGTVTLQPPSPLEIVCPSNVTVRATEHAGAWVAYPAPTVNGGCPPVTVTCQPPSGSLFPLGVTTVSCVASDVCDQVTGGTFTVTVLRPIRKHFFPQAVLPPPAGMYFPPETQVIHYANGLLLRAPAHRLFSASALPPPTPGANMIHTFTSQVELEISPDTGTTWMPFTASAYSQVYIVNNGTDGGDTLFGTELLALDGSGGSLPDGVMIRESPTLASLGETRIEAIQGGFMIDSFFDIFTEISTDGGMTWYPALDACSMELKADPALITPAQAPRTVAPMPNGQYVSPPEPWQYGADGIMLKAVRTKLFTQWLEPPPFGSTQTHTCDVQFDFLFSTDGGATWTPTRAPGSLSFKCRDVREFAGQTTFETAMTQLDIADGGLPASVRIRESPTKSSEGGTCHAAAEGGGYGISSFFDIFTEISTDGGSSWSPATNGPGRVELAQVAPRHDYASNVLPPKESRYVPRQPLFATYACGIMLTNVIPRLFTATAEPPAPGMSMLHSFGAQVELALSHDSGITWHTASAPASITILITCGLGGDGSTEYYDTEMQQLDISGGDLTALGVQIRESPTRASLGRTTATDLSGGYRIDSFFDIYTEISTDGGMTWSPTISGPATMLLEPDPPLAITCPADISVPATNWNGRAVSYPPPVTSGGIPPVTVTYIPPSGSVFPMGGTLVGCQAEDAIGQTSDCTFLVTVTSDLETDTFPHSVAHLTLQGPTGGNETIDLAGPSRMEAYVGTKGEAEDSDGNGRDDVAVELAEYTLCGYSAMLGAPVALRRATALRTPGQHEEQVNSTAMTLDVPPFAATGFCDSFFDIFTEIEVGAQIVHPSSAFRIQTVTGYKPPPPGVTYVASPQLSAPLLNEEEQATGITLTGFAYMPSTTAEIDTAAHIDTYLSLQLPDGRGDSVRLTGEARTHVYFEGGEGQANDNDSDGLDEVVQKLDHLELSGVCRLGPIFLSLAPSPVSLGQLEEQANNTAGLLDVPPFAIGTCSSFFDVFYLLTVNGQTYHNVLPWHLSGTLSHKPNAAGDLLSNTPELPVELVDANNGATQVRLISQWLALTPPELDITPASGASMQVSWPDPSTGYQLLFCTNLLPPVLWHNVTNAPLAVGDRKTVTVERSGTNRFFKLERPLP